MSVKIVTPPTARIRVRTTTPSTVAVLKPRKTRKTNIARSRRVSIK